MECHVDRVNGRMVAGELNVIFSTKLLVRNNCRCEKHNPCDHDCFDTGTSVECSCRTGYELAPDKKSCKGDVLFKVH